MKVIYVTSRLPYGPGEPFIIPEIRELKSQGHDVLLVPMNPNGQVIHKEAKSFLPFTQMQPLLSFEIFRVALWTFLQKPLNILLLLALLFKSRNWRILLKNLTVFPKALWLSNLAQNWKASHIHAHWAATSSTMAMLASELSGIPWSFTAHRWDIAENNLIAQKTRRASFVRTIDRNGAKEIKALADIDSWEPRVIHVGVLIPITSTPDSKSPNGNIFRIVMAANYVKVKGHIYLIEAVRILRDKNKPVCVELLGDGILRESIEQKVMQYKLEGNVKFSGQISHDQLISKMQSGAWDVMVLPSIVDQTGEREGIPVSLMEAMSCGIPVISTTTGGIPELLGEEAGVMVPPKDPVALAEAIEHLMENPDMRKHLAIRGKHRVQESFSIENVVNELAMYFSGSKGI